MAKRSIRSTRHRSDAKQTLKFKQLVALGSVHAQLVRGEINYNDVPQWMRDISKTAQQEAELNSVVQTEIDHAMIADRVADVQAGTAVELSLDDVVAHVHGENCNHSR